MEEFNFLPESVKDEVLSITGAIEELEIQLKEYKVIQDKYEEFRQQLYSTMSEHSISKFTSNGGILFTIVSESPTKTELVLEFDVDKLKKDNPDLYKEYLTQKEKITKGKSGYLRITIPKEKED